MSGARWGAGFAAAGRFVAEIEAAQAGTGKLRAGYALLGDEAFLLDRCRASVLKAFVPDELRDFSLSDLDLASTSIFEVLDRAQTPSLMAPFQVIFVRNVRQLYTRGAKKVGHHQDMRCRRDHSGLLFSDTEKHLYRQRQDPPPPEGFGRRAFSTCSARPAAWLHWQEEWAVWG